MPGHPAGPRPGARLEHDGVDHRRVATLAHRDCAGKFGYVYETPAGRVVELARQPVHKGTPGEWMLTAEGRPSPNIYWVLYPFDEVPFAPMLLCGRCGSSPRVRWGVIADLIGKGRSSIAIGSDGGLRRSRMLPNN